jgi:hypothetical protein
MPRSTAAVEKFFQLSLLRLVSAGFLAVAVRATSMPFGENCRSRKLDLARSTGGPPGFPIQHTRPAGP